MKLKNLIFLSAILFLTQVSLANANHIISIERNYSLSYSSDIDGKFAHGHVLLTGYRAESVAGVNMYGVVGQIRFTPFPDHLCQTNISPFGNGADIYLVCWNPIDLRGYPFPATGVVEVLIKAP